MTGFARRPIAFFVCYMLAGMQVSHAAIDPARLPLPLVEPVDSASSESSTAVLRLAANETPVQLRVERRFNLLGKKKVSPKPEPWLQKPAELKTDDSYPLFLVADNIEGRVDDLIKAAGNVELRQAGSLIFADKMTYWPLEDEVEAIGNVEMVQDGAEIKTPYLRMKLAEQIGFTERAEYRIVKEVSSKFFQPQQAMVRAASTNAVSGGAPMMLNVPDSYGLATKAPATRPSEGSGQAERVDFQGENQIHLTTATYSTCKPGRPDWYLQASEMHLDYDEDVADAKHASLWFKDVPIFYFPVASFALNRTRHSGFLHPVFSASTKNGLDLAVPYYWSIAPNYDATFYPRYMAKRGFQLGAEVQYLDYNYRGVTRLEYLPNDEVDNRKRYAYKFEHQQNFGRGFSGALNWNGVSDDLYWQDMSSRLLQTSLTQLPRQVALNYSPAPWLQISTQVLHYQTLQPDPKNPIDRPYFLEPQINIFGYKPNVLKTDLSLISQYSRFVHPTKDQGDRFVFYPQVSLPIVHPAFQITPKIGLHLTKYDINRQQNIGDPTSISRVLPTFTLDSTVVFEREKKWLDSEYIQTLEPRLYYVNIPYKDQSKIPVFDSGLTDFNFAQIFSENRYSGFDRVNDANQLTAALTTRLLDANTGVERFKAMVGQRYYFKPQQVNLPKEATRPADFSNFVAAATGLILPKTYADVTWEYNYKTGTTERFSAGSRFQPELGKVLSASYRYTSDPLTQKSTVSQIDIAGQWPISAQWYAVGRYNYSIRDKQLLEAIAGVEYNAGCWATRFVAQRLEALAGVPNTSFFVQLELSDFGSVGSSPIGLLRRSIPGYGKTNELPTGGSLLTTP
ncbi:MAG: LPS-assembly protein LptD [Azonexus sp.]|nr:LPS-assembly protein LptD [Azonexus sp.]